MGNSSSVEEPTEEEGAADVGDDTINLLLLGTVGTGKSTTGNKLLDHKKSQFEANDSDASITSECQAEYSRYGDQIIKVVDMPGLNNKSCKENAEKHVFEAVINALVNTPTGYDAFLMVIKHGKQDNVTEITRDQLKKMFGSDFFKHYGILVVTHGDDFTRERPGLKNIGYEEYCSKQSGPIKTLWEECDKRVVLFDNATKNQDKINNQKDELFAIVEKMRKTKRYTPDVFKASAAEKRWLVRQAKEERFTQSVIKRTRLIMHDLENVDPEDPTESEVQLLLLKCKVEDQLENASFMHETSLKEEFKQLLRSLKEAVQMKQELVGMIKQYKASTKSEDNLSAARDRKKIDLDDMKKKMTDKEADLDKKYWSFSEKEIAKRKPKGMFLKKY